MSKQTFAERCKIAEQCLPDAPYRAMLTNLHAEMLEALAEQPAQQEPVAAQSVITVRIWRDKNSDQNAEFKNWHKLPDGEHILYTSPPAQRTWVGLTVDEIVELVKRLRDAPVALADAIEAKLREKNTP